MSARVIDAEHPIVYVCAEFGFQSDLPFYMGGLGILAGDTLKAAQDAAFPLTAVGLLYRGHFLKQELDAEGKQRDADWEFDPVSCGIEHVYLDGQPLFVQVPLGDQVVWLRCWKKTFSDQVVLYLLDANTDQNAPEQRNLTELLYVGDETYQVRQQILLGVGAVQVMNALHVTPSLYHFNEGRPVFAHWQLIIDFMQLHQVDAQTALRLVREHIVYSNHTLVPAGNMSYSISQLRDLAATYADAMGISVEQLLSLGSYTNPDAYSTTIAALNVSVRANGVSQDHTRLSQRIWPDYSWVQVTNGVHRGTWQDPKMVEVVNSASDLWNHHQALKRQTRAFIQSQTGFGYDENRMVVSWARRIVGYKQLDKLFAEVETLRHVVANADRPIQLLVAGKAHPGGVIDKDLIAHIIQEFSTRLSGFALFIPNYRLEVGQALTRGSDVWVNSPLPGNEASGTSGMKAISNGVLQLTTLDGWTKEVEWSDMGWVLDSATLSTSFPRLLGESIAPLFYDRDSTGVPQEWVKKMQRSIALFNHFTAQRMLTEYRQRLYLEAV